MRINCFSSLRPDQLDQLITRFVININSDDPSTLFSKQKSSFFSDAAGGSGNECCFFLKSHELFLVI